MKSLASPDGPMPHGTDALRTMPQSVEIPIAEANTLWFGACLILALTGFNGQLRARQKSERLKEQADATLAKRDAEITRLRAEAKQLREANKQHREGMKAERLKPIPAWFDASEHHSVAGLCKTIDNQIKTIKDLERHLSLMESHYKEQRNKSMVRGGYIVLCSRLLGEALGIVKTIEQDEEITRWTGAVVALSKKLQPFLVSYKIQTDPQEGARS